MQFYFRKHKSKIIRNRKNWIVRYWILIRFEMLHLVPGWNDPKPPDTSPASWRRRKSLGPEPIWPPARRHQDRLRRQERCLRRLYFVRRNLQQLHLRSLGKRCKRHHHRKDQVSSRQSLEFLLVMSCPLRNYFKLFFSSSDFCPMAWYKLK